MVAPLPPAPTLPAPLQDARGELLELFGDLGGRSVEVVGYRLLLGGGQRVEERQVVAVDARLDGEVGGAEEELLAAAERRRLLPHVHLEGGEQLDVLARGEREQCADAAEEGRVEDHLGAARPERHLLQRRDRLAHVELHNLLRLGRRAVERKVVAAGARRHQRRVVRVVAHLARQAADEDVAELVGARERVRVERAGGGEPARRDVIGEDGERVVGALVVHKVEGLGEVADDDALRRDDVQRLHHRRQPLELRLAQQLLRAHLVDAQPATDADEHAAAERRDGGGHVLHLRLVDEVELRVALGELVHVQVAAGQRARVQRHVFDGADDDEGLAAALAQRHRRHRDGRLVLGELDDGEGAPRRQVEHADGRGPLARPTPGHADARLHQHAVRLLLLRQHGPRGQRRRDAGCLVQLHLLVGGERVVVALDDHHMAGDGVVRHPARRVPQRHRLRGEGVAEPVDGDDAQRVARDGDEALGAVLRREGRARVERHVRERRRVQRARERVEHPRTRGEGEHAVAAAERGAEEARRLAAEEAGARVRELA
mmetsp:Transcript_23153/g.78133  ORF Transcript_23153/g.78133 Transcript_23153/m.78133 type:complete len:545 (+) Transcript_23153:231-1865(+)